MPVNLGPGEARHDGCMTTRFYYFSMVLLTFCVFALLMGVAALR
jgi:hypothetical protein